MGTLGLEDESFSMSMRFAAISEVRVSWRKGSAMVSTVIALLKPQGPAKCAETLRRLKVVVPIKPGHEAAVGFFMETGDIWTGSRMMMHTDYETYLSLVNEMNDVEGVMEDEWQTTVPTMLTIIQDKSVGFVAGGLPCCEFDPDEEVNEIIVQSLNKLTLLGETPTPPGGDV